MSNQKQITVGRLHKILEALVDKGMSRRLVCVDKTTFQHPLEEDGATILPVISVRLESHSIVDDDGFTKHRKDGSECVMTPVVIRGASK